MVSIKYDLFDLKLKQELNWVTWEIKGNPEVVAPEGSVVVIDKLEVIVEKTCAGVCNNPKASNYEELVEGKTVANNDLCVFPVATPSATPAATVLPNTGGAAWYTWLLGIIIVFGVGYLAGWAVNKK